MTASAAQNPPAEAPRLQAYLEHHGGLSVLRMSRAAWQALRARVDQPVLVDLTRTPLAEAARRAGAIGIAEPLGTGRARIKIYRRDDSDPMPINVDDYLVIEHFESHWNLGGLVNAASTEDNANLRRYLAENVFLVKQSRL